MKPLSSHLAWKELIMLLLEAIHQTQGVCVDVAAPTMIVASTAIWGWFQWWSLGLLSLLEWQWHLLKGVELISEDLHREVEEDTFAQVEEEAREN